MSVQVAVRVRPFNTREKELQSKLCIKMEGNVTTLQDLENPEKDRKFTFDYSFWSHDGYRTQPDGLMVPEEDFYADQQKVFNLLGSDILDNAWKGYHCTLFAYGQTGSGKSYSMMGYKPNVGIVPISCRQMFERIQQDPNNQYEVNFSMLEIYNEKVQDLFSPVSKRPPQGLKIRESPSLGFYAEGLRKYPVRSFSEIEQRMDEGSKNRSVAATQMNATSSRAHTIVLIEMKQKQTVGGKKVEKLSVMNLVDLAGSEKVEKTGATGDRLKEASAINKSLSMLGQVISTLADHAAGKNLKAKIPYRDSALTRLLKNALGGNSKTVMICAISPAQDNYEETLSTLRYADQAKKIKNKAIVNESASDKIIRELRAENSRLQDLVKDFENQLKTGQLNAQSPDAKEKLQELKDLQDNMNANQKLLEDQDKTEDERLKELQDQEDTERDKKVDLSLPYLTNLNEDPQLNNQVQYSLAKEVVQVGRKGKTDEDQPDITITGLGIKPKHCQFINENGKMYLLPGDDPKVKDNLYLNGEKVTEKIEIFQNDRIIIGQNAAFLVKVPDGQPREGTPSDENLDFEYALEEQLKQVEIIKKKAEQDLQQQFNQDLAARIKAMEEKHAAELQSYQEKLENQQDQINAKSQLRQSTIQRKQSTLKPDGVEDDKSGIDQQDIINAEQKKRDLQQQKEEFEKQYDQDKQKLIGQKAINRMKAQVEKKKT